MNYDFSKIEPKWQEKWVKDNVYVVKEDQNKPKYYVLDMFPYPSGAGLHIGHPEGYTATDIIARYKSMKGFNVLHPMGFDAFGLPTERYSMQTGVHPAVATKKNIETFKRQLNLLGFAYDWSREINTTDPKYYKWTQWMFLLMYNSWYDHEEGLAKDISELEIPSNLTDEKSKQEYIDSKRLAYISMQPVNWCEELGTVLANEEVEEWRGKGYEVERKPMRQWMLRITEYADRLLSDLDLVDWPNSTMEMQKHWIGKSKGAEIDFELVGFEDKIKVFTTRPDTIFGATYMVIAPEHSLVNRITTEAQKEKVEKFIKDSSLKTELERTELNKDKNGVFTGTYAINPASGKEIPVLISDYVLMGYGTGAIMAVPAHDERDFEFATKYSIPITQVVKPNSDGFNLEEGAFTEEGISINSTNDSISLDGLKTSEAKLKMIDWLEENGFGQGKIQFRLRDWLFSRQRYWGEPIPIILFEDGTKRAMNLDELPLELPEVDEYRPAGTGESPLATVDSWINYDDPVTGKRGKIETNTMPQWSGSCWYYLRYIDPNNDEIFSDISKQEYWMGDEGVDLYVGGAEHAVLHLLYARFWHKVLYDYGYVTSKEPFKKLFHQGLIMGTDGRKMSKSLGNVINPDDVVKEYGADSLRMFEMFLGPLEQSKPWSETGIDGIFRFLNRVWRLIVAEDGGLNQKITDSEPNADLDYVLNETIKKVGEDIENLKFNTAISQMMILVNEFYKNDNLPKSAICDFVKILSPFAPHISEELWEVLGNKSSVVHADWPIFDESKLQKSNVEIVVQVLSKIRAKINVATGLSQDEVLEFAKSEPNVQKFIEGKQIRKIIYIQDKLINLIAN
ncbi:MAG: leucine--tRNA ligase [Candidatus Kapaibacterium sp.]|nr:leucine--tRNA ligase [Ignavibacteriota bacterium]MCB9221768.1 leucine--tRNA ligase [Ignavibacteria bacterium]